MGFSVFLFLTSSIKLSQSGLDAARGASNRTGWNAFICRSFNSLSYGSDWKKMYCFSKLSAENYGHMQIVLKASFRFKYDNIYCMASLANGWCFTLWRRILISSLVMKVLRESILTTHSVVINLKEPIENY